MLRKIILYIQTEMRNLYFGVNRGFISWTYYLIWSVQYTCMSEWKLIWGKVNETGTAICKS